MEAAISTSPTTSVSPAVDRLAGQVREAVEARRPLRVTGAGTWRHAAPVDASTVLSTAALDEIIDYVPGDLTITVGAGMTLSAIEEATAQHQQWLTLDPWGSADGTIGATIASASAGPLATAFGSPRDMVLGLEAVTGAGSVVRAGGRVVKNVAGFDLARLFTGSRGTIGAITEVSLRLRGRPAVDETLVIGLSSRPDAVRDAIAAIRSWPATPFAAELLDAHTASALGLSTSHALLLRLGGNARSVASQKRRASTLGQSATVESSIWRALRQLDAECDSSFRLTDGPSSFLDRWRDAGALFGDARLVGSPLRGQIRGMLASVDRAAFTALRDRARGANLVFDSLPTPTMWNALTTSPAAASLHARIRDAFDPIGIMNPGAMRLAR
jgi:glycolate oxidase FAD binding subunit